MKRILLLILITALCRILVQAAGVAAVYSIRGVVVDSVSGETVPYAQIIPKGTFTKHLTDDDGRFDIHTPRSFVSFEVSAMGYDPVTVNIAPGMNLRSLRIPIHATGLKLSEVVAKPKREHYSKKNNPAVAFMEKVRRGGDLTDPLRLPHYRYDKYERISLALNNVKSDDKIFTTFPELVQYIDTSDVTLTPILNLSVKEKAAEVRHRRDPRSRKSYVTGLRRVGIDESFDQQAIQTLVEDVLREVDIYTNDINILQNRFVSPLGRLAPDFYKFYLSDTVRVDSTDFVILSFVPRVSETFGFTGRLWVEKDDSTMFVRRIQMNVPHDINLNFITHLYINQAYDRAADGSRLKTSDDMTAELSVLGQDLYMRRSTTYAGHSFDPISDAAFTYMGDEEIAPYAEAQPDSFWDERRLKEISSSEEHLGAMVHALRQNKLYYWGEKVIHALSTGYVGVSRRNAKFDLGPLNTFISVNSLEGLRLRVGGITTANLSKRWFAKGYVARGFKDHKWKYGATLEHSFIDKRVHPGEFPIHSIAITSKYDTDLLGQHYLFTNPDNFFLSLKRRADHQITYKLENKAVYTLELRNNFSIRAEIGHSQQQATHWMTFTDGYGVPHRNYNEAFATLQLRYAPGEKFFQTRSNRYPVNLDAPVIVLTHTFAPGGFPGNTFTVNRTELSLQKRFWFSAFGFTDIVIKGARVWNKCAYPDLIIPNANLSYTIQPESFALLNPMEFVTDTYAQWDLTYWANGALFNRIPFLKKLKLREVVNFRGFWGRLSDRNNPDLHPDLYRFPAAAQTQRLTDTPYMEASVGIDNFLRVLRIDYVWRLTYRHAPDISRGGLRIALHITF